MVKNSRWRASTPSSWMGTMLGCSSWPVICASSMKRSFLPASCWSSRYLTATSRRMSQSTARTTIPMPPRAISPARRYRTSFGARRASSSWTDAASARPAGAACARDTPPASPDRTRLLVVPSITPAGASAWAWPDDGTTSGCLQVGQWDDRPANSGFTWNFKPQWLHEKAIMPASGKVFRGLRECRSTVSPEGAEATLCEGFRGVAGVVGARGRRTAGLQPQRGAVAGKAWPGATHRRTTW